MIKRLFFSCALALLMVLGLTVLAARADGPVIDLGAGDENYRVVGEDALDYLGEIATGDVNADGIPDLIIGASGYDVTGTSPLTNAGAVYIIFGSPDLTGTLDLNGTGGDADIVIQGAVAHGYAGHTVASGDVNGDSYADIIVGADLVTYTGRIETGAVYVVPGPITQSLAGPIWLSDTNWVTLTVYGDNAQDRFGRAVAAGDVNGDMVDDLIVGAYIADGPHGSDSGRAYVFYGGTHLSGTLDLGLTTDNADVEVIGYNGYDHLGRSLTTGDVDGDGIGDLIIGAYQAGPEIGDPGAGEVVLIYGSDSLSQTIDLSDHNIVQSGLGLRFYGIDIEEGAGFYVAAGNINGDENPDNGIGYADILVGAYLETHGEDGKGYAIYGGPAITSGATIASDAWTVSISDCVDMVLYPANTGDRLGRSVSSGDLNDDGYDDFIIGASRGDPPGRTNAGETYVFYGGPNLSSTITIDPTGNTDMTVLGDDANDESGRSSAAGDVNGDGVDDLIVGAVMATSGMGEVYIIWGPKAVSITVESSVDVITAGHPVSFTVTAWNRYGQSWDVTTYTTTFDIDTEAGGNWGQNTYTTTVAGTWTVTATHKGLTGTTTITFTPDSAVDVALAPSSATREAGQSVAYTVVATDTYGNRWDATATAAYTITPGAEGNWTNNTYTTELADTWTVTATVDGENDTATLVVTHTDADSVSLEPATATREAGQDIAYTTTATDTYGNSWDATATAAYTITSDANGDWTTNVYTTESAGVWTVTATVDGVDDTAELTVTHADAVSVALAPATATREAGQNIAYTTTATDTYGNSWDATATAAYTITLDADGGWVLNTYTAESAGVWTVTATVDGVDGTAILTVTPANAVDVALAPAIATREAGQDIAYTTTATDTYGNSWDATAEAVYTITLDADGSWVLNTYTTESAGVWTVTATVDGVDDTAELTVTHADAASVTLAPETATREAGQDIAYTTTATDTYGNSWDATATAAYAITPSAGGDWATNVYTTELAGAWTVTATVDGVNDTAELIVTHAGAFGLEITPASATREAGQSVAYAATAMDMYGNSWDVTAETVYAITLGAGGGCVDNVCTPTIVGTWTVTGTLAGSLGIVYDVAELTVTHASAVSMALVPAAAERTAGESIAYTTTATDTYGNNWDATATAVYTITPGAGGSWTTNIYTPALVGTWTVTATVDGIDDTATLTVTHAGLSRVGLTPESETLAAGEVVSYTLTAYDAYDNAWDVTVDGSYTITLSAGGSWDGNVYTAGIAGTWTVTGTYSGEYSTATLVVNVGSLDYIVIEDAAGGMGNAVTVHSMNNGTQFTVWAVGYDVGGNYVSDVPVTWSGTGVVTGQLSPTSGISTTFTATTAGTGTIHADDGAGRTADTGTITVTEFTLFLPLVARSG